MSSNSGIYFCFILFLKINNYNIIGFNPNSIVIVGAAIGAAAAVRHVLKKPLEIDPLYDFNNQSVEIDVSD
jgi:hypothetical protein